MALDVLEWGVILLMGAGILIWGPEKIPDMAKTLARAKREFDGATKQLQGITKELQTGISDGNLNLDSISNAIIGAGTAVGVPGNPSPQVIAQAPTGSPEISAPTELALLPPAVPQAVPLKKSPDQMLIEMARSLRIETHGKTKEEISQAIMDVVATKPLASAPAEASPIPAAPAEASPTSASSSVPAEAQTSTAPGLGPPQAEDSAAK